MANEKIVNRENLKAFRQANDQRYKDGQVVVGKSLQTKSIEAVSEESGAIQDTPFIYQGTGTANGTASVDTSPVGKQLEKQGNTIAVNQLVEHYTNRTTGGLVFTDNNNGTVSVSGLANQDNDWTFLTIPKTKLKANHKYLLYSNAKNQLVYVVNGNAYQPSGNRAIYTYTSTALDIGANYLVENGNNYNETFSVYCIDLTQWFNGDVPQDLLDNPSNFYRYYNGSLAYNTGTLTNCDGRYLVCGGRNVWNEQSDVGGINWTTGADVSTGSRLKCLGYIKVSPNTTYYFKRPNIQVDLYYYDENKNFINPKFVGFGQYTFTTPANCSYIRFLMYDGYGTTYNHDITISLYYTTGDGYDQYYPYEEPKVYDTGTETLRSAGSVRDYKTPDGTIHRLVGVVDLGTLNWTYDSTYSRWYSDQISSLIKYSVDNNTAGNLFSSLYENVSANLLLGATGMLISVNNGGRISVKNGSSTTQPTGTLNYELAEPTTEQGTPFAENIEINDYGTMGWLDTNNAYVNVPQGCKIFYPADYVLFVDSLGEYSDWTAEKLALKTDLPTAPNTYLTSLTGYDATKTQTLKNVNGTFTWVDD